MHMCVLYYEGYGAIRNERRNAPGIDDTEPSQDHRTTYFESKIPIPRDTDRDVSKHKQVYRCFSVAG